MSQWRWPAGIEKVIPVIFCRKYRRGRGKFPGKIRVSEAKIAGSCEPVHSRFCGPMVSWCAWFSSIPEIAEVSDMNYDGFQIETFEAGRGLWHARIRRADLKPVIIDGVSFHELEVGFAWSHRDAAVTDAKTRIDYLNQRCVNVEPRREIAHA
jgi:hypothetical protein